MFGRSLDIGQDIKLARVGIFLSLDIFKGHVDYRHHHVDQDHVDANLEREIKLRLY